MAKPLSYKLKREAKRILIRSGLMQPYQPEFFEGFADVSKLSAATLLPFVLGLLKPRSIVDVGCGEGYWLAEAHRLGVDDFLGLDGDYIDRTKLAIPTERFKVADLQSGVTIDRRFDMAMSLEVAEHLAPDRADSFVADLCKLAPCVLFSGACPHQGGTGHLNEQWPAFWADKFASLGYLTVDIIRLRFWNQPALAWWYSQNAVLYIHSDATRALAALDAGKPDIYARPLPLVHPSMLARHVKR